jgi:hypothetical protein
MRRILLLTIALLVTISPFLLRLAQTQEPDKPLPNPADYPEAGENCKRKVKLSPHVSTPDSGCVLDIHTCKGVETTSAARTPRTGYCDDFWAKHAALGQREICCDQGSPEEKRPPEEERPPERECAPPTPWFDTSSGCKELKPSLFSISGGAAILYMCGYPVFHSTAGTDEIYNEAYRPALRDFLQSRRLDKVCCDKFEDAVRTGKPCDPRVDVDSDGQPNRSDLQAGGILPAIDGSYTEPYGADPHAFPPGMTVDAILPPDQCRGCRWELIKGVLKCNPDPTKRHTYESSWRCPSTGEVVQVDKLSQPGARCPY